MTVLLDYLSQNVYLGQSARVSQLLSDCLLDTEKRVHFSGRDVLLTRLVTLGSLQSPLLDVLNNTLLLFAQHDI